MLEARRKEKILERKSRKVDLVMIKTDEGIVVVKGSLLDLLLEYRLITRLLLDKLAYTMEADAAWGIIEETMNTAKVSPKEAKAHLLKELQESMEERMEELSHE